MTEHQRRGMTVMQTVMLSAKALDIARGVETGLRLRLRAVQANTRRVGQRQI